MTTVTLEWSIELADGTEVMYDIECNVTAGEATVIRMDPDDSYEGSSPECEIASIKLQGLGKQPGIEVDRALWKALGFSKKELERIEEAAFEKWSEDARGYYEERD